jgi:hypothetical protein
MSNLRNTVSLRYGTCLLMNFYIYLVANFYRFRVKPLSADHGNTTISILVETRLMLFLEG